MTSRVLKVVLVPNDGQNLQHLLQAAPIISHAALPKPAMGAIVKPLI
jgi:hypothetical protein